MAVSSVANSDSFKATTLRSRDRPDAAVRRAPNLVFDAMTKPEHVRKWWDARRTIGRRLRIDLRPGGAWRFSGRGPQGGYVLRQVSRDRQAEAARLHGDHERTRTSSLS